MRIESFTVNNFRGLRYAQITGTSKSSVVTVSGPNGAGKSLLLEALTFMWRSHALGGPILNIPTVVGPWAHQTVMHLTVALAPEESQRLLAAGQERGQPVPVDPPAQLDIGLTISQIAQPQGSMHIVSSMPDYLRPRWPEDPLSLNGLLQLDYLPAERTIQRGEQAQVNPALLGRQQIEGVRNQVLQSALSRQQFVLGGVQSFLASVDYADLLADRVGQTPTRDFDVIVDAFGRATGKTIMRPSLDPTSALGTSITVVAPSGDRHSLEQLSSGEQEVLALMFYVRRLSARGGVLLVDEPETHLHPALQRSLFATLESVADRAQVWIVTHSPRLVTAAPLDSVLHMLPPQLDGGNQLKMASEEQDRTELLMGLGVHPIDVLQTDFLVIVEGSTDAQRLTAALPLELSRATVLQASGSAGVDAASKALYSSADLQNWLAIRDRDLLSDEEVERLMLLGGNVFVWPNRCIESEFCDPRALCETIARAGGVASEQDVSTWLRQIADEHRDDVFAELVEAELFRRNTYPKPDGSTPIDRLRSRLHGRRDTEDRKVQAFDLVVEEMSSNFSEMWDVKWFKLMDGKRVFSQIVGRTPFRSESALFSAMVSVFREKPDLMSDGLKDLRNRLILMPGGQKEPANS